MNRDVHLNLAHSDVQGTIFGVFLGSLLFLIKFPLASGVAMVIGKRARPFFYLAKVTFALLSVTFCLGIEPVLYSH